MPTAGNTLSVRLMRSMDIFPDSLDSKENAEAKEPGFRKMLMKYGLEDIRIEILVLRFVYGFSLAQIADELYMPSRQTAYYVLNKSLSLLKERGFSI